MTALTAKAALVDPAAIEGTGLAITTTIPRSEVEEAARAGTAELFLDVARVRDREREAEQRITVSWDPDDLEKLLHATSDDDVTFAFKADELARMFEEPDVEAQGLRERVAILTIAATAAAGISAGAAGAMVANPLGESAGSGSGPAAAFVTDASSSGPAAATQATATGGQSFVESTGGQVAIAGGLMLVILGAGFVGIRHRGGVQPA